MGGGPTAWASEGEAKARRLLLTASRQAAMGRFRQGHWGQASRVLSQEPGGSQLTMATWAAVAEQTYALPTGGWRQGAQAGGDLFGLGEPLLIPGGFYCRLPLCPLLQDC